MLEFYLGLAALPVAFYFLWGVYDPEGQQDFEYRWTHSIVHSVGAKTFVRPRHVRLRNACGLGLSLGVMALMVFGSEDTSQHTVRSKNEPQASAPSDQKLIDDTLRYEAEKGDAYYRTNSPLGRPAQ